MAPDRGGRFPRSSIRLDPVIVECLVAVAWLTVGTLGLGSDGAGTLLLAAGIALVVFIVVENRRRGSRAFDPRASVDLLRYGGFAIGAILVVTVLLGLISASGLGPGVAAVITGVAFLGLARSTGQRPTQWLGIALVVLGVLGALMSTQETSSFVSQGLLGLVCGVLAAALGRGPDRAAGDAAGPGPVSAEPRELPVLSLSGTGTRRTRPPSTLRRPRARRSQGRRRRARAAGLPRRPGLARSTTPASRATRRP